MALRTRGRPRPQAPAQDDYAAHVYRLLPGGSWSFDAFGGEDAVLRLDSLGIEIPMTEIYAFVSLPRAAEDSSLV